MKKFQLRIEGEPTQDFGEFESMQEAKAEAEDYIESGSWPEDGEVGYVLNEIDEDGETVDSDGGTVEVKKSR